jgi:hypothetical protein
VDSSRLHLPDVFPWWTPDTPDLGCFVRRAHELETYDFHVYGEPSPWVISGGSLRYLDHQAYFRVKCGRAAYYQRCLVYMRGPSATITDVLGMTPEWVLGGNHRPYPSEWLKYPPQDDGRTYFFAGEHRNPAETAWRWDAAVGHTYDIYDNGTLATVKWDDTGGDRDFDDFVVEVAVVRRPRFFVDLVLERDEAATKRFAEEVEPKLERPDRSHAGD